MLSNVSWGQYLVVVGILLVIYYFFIGIRYYKEDIKSLISGKLLKKDKADNNTDPSFDELETVVNDLRYAVLERAGKQANQTELLEQLKQRLAKYAGLQKPAYRVAINNYIITNAKDMCEVMFSEDELNRAWESLPH